MEEILISFIIRYFKGNCFNPYNTESLLLAEEMLNEMVAIHPEFNTLEEEEYTRFTVMVERNEFMLSKGGHNEFKFGHFGGMKMLEVGKATSASVHQHVGWRHRD